jgi:hypothetical protein
MINHLLARLDGVKFGTVKNAYRGPESIPPENNPLCEPSCELSAQGSGGAFSRQPEGRISRVIATAHEELRGEH